MVVKLAGTLAVTARITASISDGFCYYFAAALQKSRGFCASAPLLGCFSADYQPGRLHRLDSPALSRYSSSIVVDLSRPACGHVKEALKGREF
jgi:hypothetical protein